MRSLVVIKEHTASLDVDAQKGFTPLCPDELPVPEGHMIAEELNAQAKHARIRVGSKDAHCAKALHISTSEHPPFSLVGAPDTDIRWKAHCIMGTPGAEAIPGLPHWKEYDFFVWKGIEPDTHPYGACYHDLAESRSTGLIEYLKHNGIKLVLVGGLATDFCVLTSVLQLLRAGFQVALNLAACRGIGLAGSEGKDSIRSAIEKMEAAGAAVFENAAAIAAAGTRDAVRTFP